MKPPVTWRTDDPCPVCATGLLASADQPGPVRQDCAAVRLVGHLEHRKEAADDRAHPR